MAGKSFESYLEDPAYGSSDLRTFRRGPPCLVPWHRQNRAAHTEATRIGEAAHCLILTPHLYDGLYAHKPAGMTFASTVGKEWREAQAKRGIDQDMILARDEWEAVLAVREAFFSKEPASRSLADAEIERSVFWTDRHGLPRKARPDWFDHSYVYDLKVTVEAEKGLDTLRYKAFSNGWLHQLASGAEGLRDVGVPIVGGRLVVIAPNPPQALRVWLLEVSGNDLDVLILDNENTSREMVPCHRSGLWPGTPDEWVKCPLPVDHLMADLEGAEVADAEA